VTTIDLRTWHPPADGEAGLPHYRSAGPDGVRYKVLKTPAIGHATPGRSAAVADGGLA